MVYITNCIPDRVDECIFYFAKSNVVNIEWMCVAKISSVIVPQNPVFAIYNHGTLKFVLIPFQQFDFGGG
ncbi:hypothetical protein SDC9_24981 [bioreactor metagenome]|uniref:Uncharacterized protein n=1 Tax=bioreactor metagenome TaxID=1076179 RepID=A0A644UJB2_9ZZZZ